MPRSNQPPPLDGIVKYGDYAGALAEAFESQEGTCVIWSEVYEPVGPLKHLAQFVKLCWADVIRWLKGNWECSRYIRKEQNDE